MTHEIIRQLPVNRRPVYFSGNKDLVIRSLDNGFIFSAMFASSDHPWRVPD